jgi:GH43 family beta-xylosidase
VRRAGSLSVSVAARGAVLSLALASLACARGATVASSAPTNTSAPTCTFTNPVGAGADPWVVRHDGVYYHVKSQGRQIQVSASPRLTDVVAAPATPVGTAPDTGWNRSNVWAPELHHRNGRWYIYYAAGRAGPPFTSQQAGVLESVDGNPLGRYVDRGMLYTGDSVGTGTGNRWSIDLTIGRIGGRDYAVWSGWATRAATDKTPQQLYIAPMSNPWTISANRVLLSAPEESWERGPELDLQEGPTLLQRGGDVFLIYSTRDSWLKEYSLGQLRLRDTLSDPMNPLNWTKKGPVFEGSASVFGVGHASFTTAPDGAEPWIVYHTKDSAVPGWKRSVHMQPFAWSPSGEPVFGAPAAGGARIRSPRGECPQS